MNALAYNNRGVTLIELEKYQEAIVDFRIALKIDRSNPVPYNNAGYAYLKMGNCKKALENYDLAMKKGGPGYVPHKKYMEEAVKMCKEKE